MLDYGVKPEEPEPLFPSHIAPRDVDAVILTHPHLDHIGATPIFMLSNNLDVYATEMAYRVGDILLRDFIKLSGYYLPYEVLEVKELLKKGKRVAYGETVRIKDVEITFIDAGHIPGSAQILVNGDKTLLYTGDFSTIKTRLLRGAEPGPRDVD
ncbi:MAG: MBL fold metallo-hydrolase, partial [Nitrososphaerota archaeon]